MKRIALFLLMMAAAISAQTHEILLRLASARADLAEFQKAKRETTLLLRRLVQDSAAAKEPEARKHRFILETKLADLEATENSLVERIKKVEERFNLKRPCPLCGGTLVAIAKVDDEPKKPSKNSFVWLRGGKSYLCGSPYLSFSPICTRCWTAQSFETGDWGRASVNAKSFTPTLSQAIQNFPLPPRHLRQGEVSYERLLDDGVRSDAVSFNGNPDDGYLRLAREFARIHQLHVLIRGDGQVGRYIRISTKHPQDRAGG